MKQNFRVLSVVLILFSSLFTLSCRQETNVDNEMNKFRSQLILKTEVQQKEIFKSMSTSEKVRLWQSKLSQILKQDLTDKQRDLTKQIIDEIPNLNNENYDGENLITLAIEMAKITPEDEYIRMFSMFEDYKRNQSEYKKFNNEMIVNDLIAFKNSLKVKNENTINNFNNTNKKACNCRWTCGFYNYTDNCTETENGCGFLGLQPCTGMV